MAKTSTAQADSAATRVAADSNALALFHPCTQAWFTEAFANPTRVQSESWPFLRRGESSLMLAPTGSGKTLAAFLAALDGLLFGEKKSEPGVKVIYISPLKALGVDVDRNLRAPLAGISAVAAREGTAHHTVTVAIRSGDTESRERARMLKEPPDVLITTPESLYLMLTSRARDILQGVETIILDEIHTMVPTKRGTHLFLSLERLEQLRRQQLPGIRPMQRIGLSATQRPLEEVARLMGGFEHKGNSQSQPRTVQIIDASEKRPFELTICMPLGDQVDQPADEFNVVGNAATSPVPASIWPAIYPRLVALIGDHRSTMIFVNSRRLAERLAASINETAEQDLARAHHGSMSKDTRAEVEDRLKRGDLRAIVATSSMELGIDMGAVDLVIQVEAPPSISSGLQRIGRAGHSVGAVSKGIVFPKYRGDLLSAAAAARQMLNGQVESSAYLRNPLDVLAQQIVAMVAMDEWDVEALYQTLRCAAPFAELPRASFEEVLNLLSGRYPSDDFSGLKARITWDRINNHLTPRRGAQRTAILNAGTIPDRGLYGVFLLGGGDTKSRVGELDEEMVFELQIGEVFRLGASMWRTLEITKDQVLVEPAPGEQGKMPFWRGDGVGRPLEFGRAIGALTRILSRASRADAQKLLTRDHALEAEAADILYDYVAGQFEAAGDVPSDECIIVENFIDEVGDWRVVLQSPFGARVHAPWAMTIRARLIELFPYDLDVVWSDDGMVFRLPDGDRLPAVDMFFPEADQVDELVINRLAETSLFAARFRENAGRALLLPKRFPGQRTPLWLQRRKSADLMQAASQYPRFPMILETYRECLRDVFDIDGLNQLLEDIHSRRIRVHSVNSDSASPFAQTVLFDFTASFIYDADAPLAERRAQVLSLDHAQLKELLGSADYRELLDPEAIAAITLKRQLMEHPYVKDPDDVHDLLLALGDLSATDIFDRTDSGQQAVLQSMLSELTRARRIIEIRVAGNPRYIAAEDAARYRDALGTVLPMGLPAALLEPCQSPMQDLVSRYLRTHGPFEPAEIAQHFGLGIDVMRKALNELSATGRVLEGGFTPGSTRREWIDHDVLKQIKRRSLAGWRHQIEAVDHNKFASFIADWQFITKPRRGLDALYDTIEQLQGAPLPASVLETEILPARITGYRVGQIDELFVSGEVLWRGIEPVGSSDGRIAIYLAENYPLLAPEPNPIDNELAQRIHEFIGSRGAPFFDDIVEAVGGFQNDVLEALWELVWSGNAGNDSFAPLRARLGVKDRKPRTRRAQQRMRPRRGSRLPGSEGRWTLFDRVGWEQPSATEARTAQVQQLLERYGVMVKEALTKEGVTGGFSGIYPVLKAMEEAGRIRRGYFVEGLGASQFAVPGAEDRLRNTAESTDPVLLSATDPANPYGALLPWPSAADGGKRCARVAGSRVLLLNGDLIAYIAKTGDQITTFLPPDEPTRSSGIKALIAGLKLAARGRKLVYLASIDGKPRAEESIHAALLGGGFQHAHRGYSCRSIEATQNHA